MRTIVLLMIALCSFSVVSSAQEPVSSEAPEAQGKMREILVELAWQGDPQVCRFPLIPRALGSEMHVLGSVCDEKARERVLELARETSNMTLVDHLQLDPRQGGGFRSRPAHLVQREAVKLLAMAHPQLAPRLQLQARNLGQILVRGLVPSQEDKLLVGRSLREVAGCSCIINQLQVVVDPVATLAAPTPILQPLNHSSLPPAELEQPPNASVMIARPPETEIVRTRYEVEVAEPPPVDVRETLEQKLERTVGFPVRLIHTGPDTVRIELRAISIVHGEMLSKRIFEIPDLAAMAVDLDITLDP